MILLVCGRFDDNGGRPSGYAEKIFAGQQNSRDADFGNSMGWKFINGGRFEELRQIDVTQYDTIIWFADVPNDKPKIVNEIKVRNPKCLLVTSKRNDDGKYKPLDLIERALRTKSNLLVEFTMKSGMIAATIWDALGNVYLEQSTSTIEVHDVLFERLSQLAKVIRVGSIRIGDAEKVPDQPEFFQLARTYATSFHRLIHAVNTERFVGNLSFRCEMGFPSFRNSDRVYVSKRNIDKRDISADGFVAVKFDQMKVNSCGDVEYFGDNKPSVDTPIQLLLYAIFPKIRFIIHSHAYVEGGEYTNEVLPCGDAREAIAIETIAVRKTYDDIANVTFFAVNLRGHGSIIGASNVEALRGLPYVARELPERQTYATMQEVCAG